MNSLRIVYKVLGLLIALYSATVFAQQNEGGVLQGGELHGNFELNSAYYVPDSAIGAQVPPEKIGLNAYINLIYTYQKVEAGLRYESYQPALLGYSPQFRGNGVMYRYARYRGDNLDVTLGSFYEQFGNGQILRTFFEPGFGIDNNIDGARFKFSPDSRLFNVTSLIGRQRNYFSYGGGLIRALDGELVVSDLFKEGAQTRLIVAGSVVSKYQEDDNLLFDLPENTLAYNGRFTLGYKRFSLNGEYTFKYNDPNADNNFSYKNGQSIYLSGGYSKKGLGITLSAKTLDNMFFRSDRNNSSQFPELFINYTPALTKQHTYNLMTTLYPYATQPAGELAFQGDIIYTFQKGTPLGGKYGTTVAVNVSYASNIDTVHINDLNTTRLVYESDLFKGGEKYWHDANIEISKKLNANWKGKLTYQNLFYNRDVIEGKPGAENIRANVVVLDVLSKIDKKNSIRTELQHLSTQEHLGDWATVVIEYTRSPHWFVSLMDQYNYGNPISKDRLHYLNFTTGYVKDATRISLGFGRQRAGIFCVGGICRVVPASSGLSINISSSF